MKKRIFIITICFFITIIGGILFINTKHTLANDIKSELVKNNVNIKEFTINDDIVKATIVSKNINRATPEDIKAIRTIKNEIRSQYKNNKSARTRLVKQKLTIIIIDNSGKKIMEATENVIDDIISPNTELILNETQDKGELLNIVENRLTSLDNIKIDNIIDSMLGGYLFEFSMDFIGVGFDNMNSEIAKLQSLLSEINKTNPLATEFTLTVYNEKKEILVYLTADLEKRDYTWWQDESIESTWSGNTPLIK